MPKYCHECGAQLFDENAKFCSECGTITKKEPIISNNNAPSEVSSILKPVISEQVIEKTRKSNNRAWGIMAILLALVLPFLVNAFKLSTIFSLRNFYLAIAISVIGYIAAIILFIYGIVLLLKS